MTAVGALNGDVVQLVGGMADPGIEVAPRGLRPHEIARVLRPPDPAEVIVPQAEDSAIIDHAAMFITDRRIDHLAYRQFFHVAGDAGLHQFLSIWASDFVFA